jgi:hypothetical protein
MVDDMAQQDEARTVPGVLRHRVGVVDHRQAGAIGDAREHRDDFVVAFQRVDHDGALAGRRFGQAGCANEGFDAGIGEHVRQVLFGHAQWFDGEEGVEGTCDVLVGARHDEAVAGQRLQLLFLGADAAAETLADDVLRVRAGRHAQHRTAIGRGLVRKLRQRIGNAIPCLRLMRQRQQVDAVAIGCDRGKNAIDVGLAGGGCEVAPPQTHVEGRMFAAEEARDMDTVFAGGAERQQHQRAAVAAGGDDNEWLDALVYASMALPGMEEIELLKGGVEMIGRLHPAPDAFGIRQIVMDRDVGDGADGTNAHAGGLAFVFSDRNHCGLCSITDRAGPCLPPSGRPFQRNVNKG